MFAEGPRTGGSPPPFLPRGGVNNSIRDEISRDAKHVGETRRCTRRARRARRVSSWRVAARHTPRGIINSIAVFFSLYRDGDDSRATRERAARPRSSLVISNLLFRRVVNVNGVATTGPRRYLSSLSAVPSIVRISCLEAVQPRMYRRCTAVFLQEEKVDAEIKAGTASSPRISLRGDFRSEKMAEKAKWHARSLAYRFNEWDIFQPRLCDNLNEVGRRRSFEQ